MLSARPLACDLAGKSPEDVYKRQAMECLPESLRGRRYYTPAGHGSEARVVERMRQIEALRAEIRAREAGNGAQEAENREK